MTESMPPLKTCIGCGKYKPVQCYMRVAFKSKNEKEIYCPCTECLVKSMCTEVCDKLELYSNQLYHALYEASGGR